ncbi:acyl carrier protein [Emcibacter sp.]|uniref:acyl carrier protein n=1 Tax=Emcibacter sp. TaxID=1979954 RepID=UPI003A8F20C9
MTDTNSTLDQICTLVAPFNKKGIPLTADTTFSTDLELDSLAVMDLLAEIEDHFDITVPLNILPDLEKVGQVADAVDKILSEQ